MPFPVVGKGIFRFVGFGDGKSNLFKPLGGVDEMLIQQSGFVALKRASAACFFSPGGEKKDAATPPQPLSLAIIRWPGVGLPSCMRTLMSVTSTTSKPVAASLSRT